MSNTCTIPMLLLNPGLPIATMLSCRRSIEAPNASPPPPMPCNGVLTGVHGVAVGTTVGEDVGNCDWVGAKVTGDARTRGEGLFPPVTPTATPIAIAVTTTMAVPTTRAVRRVFRRSPLITLAFWLLSSSKIAGPSIFELTASMKVRCSRLPTDCQKSL